MQTRIIVLDRHALFRRGVVALAREAHADWQCVDTESLDGLRTALLSETPVLAMVDLDHPELGGATGFAALVDTYPQHIFVACPTTMTVPRSWPASPPARGAICCAPPTRPNSCAPWKPFLMAASSRRPR